MHLRNFVKECELSPVNTPLVGFGRDIARCGEITIPLYLGTRPARETKLVNLLVVKAPSTYNLILGRPTLNFYEDIASTYHMKV